MMVSKPKASNSSESLEIAFDVSDNREKDLERRLALLGDITINEGDDEAIVQGDANILEEPPVVEGQPAVEPENPTPVQVMKAPIMNPRSIMIEKKVAEPTLVEERPTLAEEQPTPYEEEEPRFLTVKVHKPPVMNPRPIMIEKDIESTPKVAPVPTKGNKNALLARIMAVQEKAKQAQLKKASETVEFAPPTSDISVKEEMMRKLNGGNEMNNAPPIMAPPQFPQTIEKQTVTEQAPTVADYRDKMMEALNDGMQKKKQNVPPPPPPPPSFDVVEMQHHQETKPPLPLAPPSFDAIEYNMMDETVMPSAPPVEALPPPDLLSGNHLAGITSIVPPPPTTEQLPPSFESVQQHQQNDVEEDEMCDFDLEGNKLTPEEKRKMMEEQRAILAQIQKSSTENSVSEAAARAVAFDQRSNTAAAAAASASENISTMPISCEVASSTDGVERDVKQRSVDIGGGQKVALHGQEKTRTAIKNGTAVLVKCLNCDNWMQVTQSATLMFCPICSVVSPVVKQDNTPTTEEARQMDEDRKLAEKLQKEEDSRQRGGGQSEGYPATRRGGTAENDTSSSWLGGLLPANMWSTTEETNSGSAEITVSRPPGGLINANIGTRASEGNDLRLEEESLLGSGQQNRRRPGRVAEQKPMFSCVVDSISSTANAMTGAMSSYTNVDNDDTVHGVDSSSFLSVTNAERGENDGSGSYRPV